MKMEKLCFKFVVLGSTDGKTNVINITSIETPDGHIYEVPDELKPANKHSGIMSLDIYTKIRNSLKKRHQTRSVWIPLDAKLREIYLDEGENLQFGDQYLNDVTNDTHLNKTSYDNVIENKNLGKLAERFVLEKFSTKISNANQWISDFESECGRFDIQQDESKIEILKHLLEKQCLDWYSSMIIKLRVNSDWIQWRNIFCETYGNKGWSQVKYAFTFRYQAGSLLEYAAKKESILLEVIKEMDTQTMINLIVMGLPDNIIDKINKETLKSIASLYTEIGKHEYLAKKNNFIKNKKNITDLKVLSDRSMQVKPCKICENLKKGVRYHPEGKCWFKQTEEQNPKRNYSKAINNSVIDVELNTNESKNE